MSSFIAQWLRVERECELTLMRRIDARNERKQDDSDSDSDEIMSCTLMSLPDELLELVALKLTSVHSLVALSEVNRRLFSLVNNAHRVWHAFARRDFGSALVNAHCYQHGSRTYTASSRYRALLMRREQQCNDVNIRMRPTTCVLVDRNENDDENDENGNGARHFWIWALVGATFSMAPVKAMCDVAVLMRGGGSELGALKLSSCDTSRWPGVSLLARVYAFRWPLTAARVAIACAVVCNVHRRILASVSRRVRVGRFGFAAVHAAVAAAVALGSHWLDVSAARLVYAPLLCKCHRLRSRYYTGQLRHGAAIELFKEVLVVLFSGAWLRTLPAAMARAALAVGMASLLDSLGRAARTQPVADALTWRVISMRLRTLAPMLVAAPTQPLEIAELASIVRQLPLDVSMAQPPRIALTSFVKSPLAALRSLLRRHLLADGPHTIAVAMLLANICIVLSLGLHRRLLST
jgi:hypothetical protein